ncbi:MAG TPA: hypothetical protein VGR29_11170 [Thermomicrobiales bacterium]|nr:hypothetical protein [Thermomicrobiales bacterium]
MMHGKQESIPVVFEQDGVVSRQAQWGEMTVAFERAPVGTDTRPLFQGLPGDSCQCPHWGYVISGQMRVIYPDREEIVGTGEAYYLAPGHNIVCDAKGEVVEFSPHGQYQKTMQAVATRLATNEDKDS